MSHHPASIDGACDVRFEPLRELFAAKLEGGEDLGASLAVNIDGEMVVDLWGGWADVARTISWSEKTITCVFSTTKTITSLAALVLVDRGELDLDANVANYWPEFAAQGKAGIKVRHLLSHTSGVSGWNQPVTIDDVYDWDRSTSMLAAQAAWWKPGTASGYHALSYGHLIGEVIRRITGQRLGEFVASHIAGPLGADFHIGLPRSEFPRVADLLPWPPQPMDLTQLDPDGPAYKTLTGPPLDENIEHSRTERWRRADIGAANGHGNARSVARILSAVACGGEAVGIRLLSPRTIDQIFEVESDSIDLVLGVRLKIGLGYGLPSPEAVAICPRRPDMFWEWRRRLTRDHRRGSPHDDRLRDEQDGAGHGRADRIGAGRAGVRHRESIDERRESVSDRRPSSQPEAPEA